jgi:MerR family transcriptional regulator, light-induced transcriptional regulator
MSAQQHETQHEPRLRIGQLSRRTGVSPDTLRAWERRYGLLEPQRTDGGFRLYGREDEQRVWAMKALIDSGVSAAEAARMALADTTAPVAAAGAQDAVPAGGFARLVDCLARFDEPAANAILDDAVARLTAEAVSELILLPAMRDIGTRWVAGEISIAQEHFATGVLRGRLLALGRNWGAGVGPLALLACPPGERHDFGLLAFGLALRGRGWRIAFLGPDTPIETIARAAADLRPAAVVLAAMTAEPFTSAAEEISALAAEQTVLLGGAGAAPELAGGLGARVLPASPTRAAELTAAEAR